MVFQKGQKVKISDFTENGEFVVAVTVQAKTGEAMDCACFGVDGNNRLSDDRYFVFYNQMQSPNKEICMEVQREETKFSLSIASLPKTIKKLAFTITQDGEGTMQNIVRGSLKIFVRGQAVAEYTFSGTDFQKEKAIVLAELYEKEGIWRLSIVASGFNGGLSALLAHFGGEEITPQPKKQESSGMRNLGQGVKKQEPPETSKKPLNLGQAGVCQGGPKQDASMQKKESSFLQDGPRPTVNLKKAGDAHKINLSKNSRMIHVNLNWNQNSGGLFQFRKGIDLDLACMFQLKNGMKGVVQALGNTFGAQNEPPFIRLDADDRTGANTGGENMYFYKPELIEFAIVFAFIYEGVPNWNKTDAQVLLKQQDAPDIIMQMNSSSTNDRFCVIASMRSQGDHLLVMREEKYFPGHREVDAHYGFGFRWKAGRK